MGRRDDGLDGQVLGCVLQAVQSLHSLTIDVQKVLCHDDRPFVNGFAGAIENPTWEGKGVQEGVRAPSLCPATSSSYSSRVPSSSFLSPQPSHMANFHDCPCKGQGIFLPLSGIFTGKAIWSHPDHWPQPRLISNQDQAR